MGGVGSRRRVGEGLSSGGGELGWGRGGVGRRKKVARKETRWIRSKGVRSGASASDHTVQNSCEDVF
jgi:hypothetical protein